MSDVQIREFTRTACKHVAALTITEPAVRTYQLVTGCCREAAVAAAEGAACAGCGTLVPVGLLADSLVAQLAGVRCPCPADCASHTMWQLDVAAGDQD